MQKKKKIIIVISSILAGSFLTYFIGGVVAANIVSNVLFNKRFSNEEDLKNKGECNIYKIRDDYPILKDREVVSFKSDKNELTGYLYKTSSPKGIVIQGHGLSSLADGLDCQYGQYFLQNGYDLFSFDLTASGRSQGNGIRGLSQSYKDYYQAIKYVQNRDDIKDLGICLIGHSWSGYGSAAVLNLTQDIKAVCSISGFVSPVIEMKQTALNKVGWIANLGFWTLEVGLFLRNNKHEFVSAIDGINKAKNTKVMIVQGGLDKSVSLNASIYGNRKKIANTNVEYRYYEDRDHINVFRSEESNQYIKENVEPRYKEIEKEYKKFDKAPSEIKEELYKSIDKKKTSQLDSQLFIDIEKLFSSSLS